jgi:predicted nucleic acid-binding Zn ribbon protein
MAKEVNRLRKRARWIHVILVLLLLAVALSLMIFAGGCGELDT